MSYALSVFESKQWYNDVFVIHGSYVETIGKTGVTRAIVDQRLLSKPTKGYDTSMQYPLARFFSRTIHGLIVLTYIRALTKS